jgi:hypothetical protein
VGERFRGNQKEDERGPILVCTSDSSNGPLSVPAVSIPLNYNGPGGYTDFIQTGFNLLTDGRMFVSAFSVGRIFSSEQRRSRMCAAYDRSVTSSSVPVFLNFY